MAVEKKLDVNELIFKYHEEIGTSLPGPRGIRFFKIFAPMLCVDGYKKLKSVYRNVEKRISFPEPKFLEQYTYKNQWDRQCFGPESSLLLQDLQIYLSRNWILCHSDLKKGEPIHHRYYLSPLGFSNLTNEYLSVLEHLTKKLVDYRDFLSEILVWNALPTSCSLGQALQERLQEEPHQIADPEGEPLLSERNILIQFDYKLVSQIEGFYGKLLGSEFADFRKESPRSYIAFLELDPEVICPRYEYLRFKGQETIEAGRKTLKILLKKKLVPSVIFEDIEDEKSIIEEKFDEVTRGLDITRMEKAFDALKDNLYSICKATVDVEEGVKLRFLNEPRTGSGMIELYISEELGTRLSGIRDYAIQIWHALQPIEVSWLIRHYGEEWLSSKIL